MSDSARLTSSDPEPPIGSRVLDFVGMRWVREDESTYGWRLVRGGDPESWVKVAGNYGPVRLEVGEMTAEDVLTVLNELEPVDMSAWTFCVITDAPDDRIGGYDPFEKGEIVVCDGRGNEFSGQGRRPGKWDVGEAHFTTLAEALACREQVLAGTWPRSYG